MILVNIKKSGRDAVTEEQLRQAAAGDWVVSDDTLRMYGDHLVAVRDNRVLGVWTIVGHTRRDDGRARFNLAVADEPATSLVGKLSPVQWVRGAANPVKIFDAGEGRQPSSSIELTTQGNPKVVLHGWTLVVYPDGRARVSPPASDKKLIVESAFPGPNGGNVTVRVTD